MNIGSIATRYSRALFEEAREKSVDKYIYDYLGALYNNISAVPETQKVLLNPRTKKDHKFKLLLIASGLKQDEKGNKPVSSANGADLYQRFLWLVMKHNRINLMRFIIFVYQDMYRKHHNIDHVIFATAKEIDKPLEKKVIDKIHTITGREVELETRIKPDLIGGFWVVVDDKLYDFSYRTRLQNIRKSLWNK